MHALYRDHMGNDLQVVNDARISFAKDSQPVQWDEISIPVDGGPHHKVVEIPQLSTADQNLIGFLARGCRSGEWQAAVDRVADNYLTQKEANELLTWAKRMPTHWTPFGQQVIKLRMKAPVPIRTQAFKSKIGFVENEESRRYIDSTPELFIPEFRSRPEGSIKQGSGDIHPHNKTFQKIYTDRCRAAIDTYEWMIQEGIAPEQARLVLPQGVYVNWVWTGSLYAFAEFYNKRADGHAQQEIQDLAAAVAEVIQPLFPVSWQALTQS